ncbi:MAG: exo-alpha-sialidase [Prosthecobacter sp.]
MSGALLGALSIEGVSLNPLEPPLGLKTYRDLNLMVDDTMLAREWRPGTQQPGPLQKTLTNGAWVFPLYDAGNQIKLTVSDRRTVWSCYSKDKGLTWSQPRFVAATTADDAVIKGLEFRRAKGRAFSLVLDSGAKSKAEIVFKENDLRRLATGEDLRRAPPGRLVIRSVPPDNKNENLLADSLCVGGDIAFPSASPPAGYKVAPDIGLIMHESMSGAVLHRAQSKAGTLYETRAVVTPKGDFLVMIPDGEHASGPREKSNRMLGYRSGDQGKTWAGPFPAFGDEEKHHTALPLVSRGSQRIHVFETQRGAPAQGVKGGKAFGFRTSDDDGRSWSQPELIQLGNGRHFSGTGVIQMTETTAGTWMAGFHHSRMLRGALENGQRRWSDIRQPESGSAYLLDELRVLGLDGSNVMALGRTCSGRLWEMRSTDDGRTWGEAQPTKLVHPDAPPMLFHLSDGRTLIALHHNRAVPRSVHEPIHSDWLKMPTPTAAQVAEGNKFRHVLQDWVGRAEIWLSLSRDNGATWDEPRLLFANALAETLPDANSNYQCSYVDLFTDKGRVHFIVPHRWRRVLHLSMAEAALTALPTRAQLAVFAKKTSVQAKPEPNFAAKISSQIEPTRRVVYKKVGDRELGLDIFEPEGLKRGDKRPCFVAIHGGGWTSGSPRSMYVFADHCARLGMVAISVQYRLYKAKTPITVFECVKDARAALRYVRSHAAELGIDPEKIIANGASAGGHLAAATAMFDGVDHADEDTKASCHPNALVLFSPVIDTSKEGYGNAKIGERWQELSPAHQARAGLPPTLLFHGDGDTTTPIKGANIFAEAMRRAGNRIEFVSPPGAIHTYMFKDAALHEQTKQKMDAFFAELGFVKAATP